MKEEKRWSFGTKVDFKDISGKKRSALVLGYTDKGNIILEE